METETRRAAFSLSYLGVNIGVALGPLMAGWLFTHTLSWMFWLDGVSARQDRLSERARGPGS